MTAGIRIIAVLAVVVALVAIASVTRSFLTNANTRVTAAIVDVGSRATGTGLSVDMPYRLTWPEARPESSA